MTKKEKIISLFLALSMLMIIISTIYTLIINKPKNASFQIERAWINFQSKQILNKY